MNENNSVISAEELEKKFDNILMNRFRLIHHKLIASLMGQIAALYIRQAEEPKPVHDEAASRERGLILEFLERESREIGNACGRAARNNAYDETLTYIRKVEAIAASKGAEIERLKAELSALKKEEGEEWMLSFNPFLMIPHYICAPGDEGNYNLMEGYKWVKIRLPRQESEAEAVCRELQGDAASLHDDDPLRGRIERAIALLQSK